MNNTEILDTIEILDEDDKDNNCYLRSRNNTAIVDTIEILDEDEKDDDCQIVEEIVLFHEIPDDDDCNVIYVPNETVSPIRKFNSKTIYLFSELSHSSFISFFVGKKILYCFWKIASYFFPVTNINCKQYMNKRYTLI